MAAFAAGLDQILPAERVEQMLTPEDGAVQSLGWGVGCPAHSGIASGAGAGHGGGGHDDQVVMVWRPDGSSSAYALSMQGQPFKSTFAAFYVMASKLASHLAIATRCELHHKQEHGDGLEVNFNVLVTQSQSPIAC